MYIKYLTIFCICISFPWTVESAKILGVFHMSGPSHYLAGSSLMKILAEKGHDVTIIGAFSEKNPLPNYKQVVLTGQYEKLKGKIVFEMRNIEKFNKYHLTRSCFEVKLFLSTSNNILHLWFV